jgi:hypothetical protein
VRRYSLRTIVGANLIKHSLRDANGCSVAEFTFVSYNPLVPPPDRAKVVAACFALIPEGSDIRDAGTTDES